MFVQPFFFVGPECQRSGKLKLLAFGTDQSDEQGVPCWPESSVVVSRVDYPISDPFSLLCYLPLTLAT